MDDTDDTQNTNDARGMTETSMTEPLSNNSSDTMVHATVADGTVRCMATVTTETVAEAVRRHQTSNTAAAALGRTLTGTLLLGASLKELDRLTVQIVGDGALGGITAEATAHGTVRGYVRNPEADVPLNAKGKFDVSALVGNGMFYVTRESGYDIGLYRDPYRGSVPIVSGEIAEDFAFYLTKSEQIPSAVMLGVLMRARDAGDVYVEAAGGIMIQLMPGADDKTAKQIEESVARAPHTTKLIRDGAMPADMLREVLGEMEFETLDERPVSFACTCSYERAVSIISSIDRAELEAMLREDKGAAMTCHFCMATYTLDEAELQAILEQGRSR